MHTCLVASVMSDSFQLHGLYSLPGSFVNEPWGPGRCGSCDHSISQVEERGTEGRDPGDGRPGKEELQSGAVSGSHEK